MPRITRSTPVSAGPPTLCAGLLVFASCGGDGGSAALGYGSPILPIFERYPTLEGVYRGTLTGTSSGDLFAVVLEDGELWAFQGRDFGNTFVVDGLYAGHGAASGGSYSGELRDFGQPQAPSGRVTGTYDARLDDFNGRVDFAAGTLQFATHWFAGAAGAGAYEFERPASLALVAGHWDLLAFTGEGFSLDAAPGGEVTLTGTGGCTARGRLAPSASDRNVYELSLVFGTAPCALPGQAVSGIAFTHELASGQRQFLAGLANAPQAWGTALFGVR